MGNNIINSPSDSTIEDVAGNTAHVDVNISSKDNVRARYNFKLSDWVGRKSVFLCNIELPILVFIRILFYAQPGSFYNVIQTSKVLNDVLNSNDYWKRYYRVFFRTEGKKGKGSINWKKEFFVRYSSTITYYKRRYEVVNNLNFGPEIKKVNVKVCVLGARKVGKTCMLHKFAKDSFEEMYTETIGAQFLFKSQCRIKKTGQIVSFHLWDASGGITEIGQHLLPLYMKGAKAMLVCFALDQKNSFNKLKFSIWTIGKYSKDINFKVLVGLKCDKPRRKVSYASAESFAKKNGFQKYVECSSKDRSAFFPFGVICDLIKLQQEAEIMKKRQRLRALREKKARQSGKSKSVRGKRKK